MLDALCEHLLVKLWEYQDELALWLWEEFGVHITVSSVSRALDSIHWTKKTMRRIAKQRNADLRD